VVGWTGVLRSWHGAELLVQALQRLPEAVLLIVGDGPERAGLERLAGSLGVAGRMRITGRIPHADVPRYVAAFDVAVAADDRTGVASPLKVVEYMALARAVVVPRLSNFSDLVRHNATGFQFTPGDARDLADRLRELAGSSELRSRLGCAARQEVCARLNWEANARAILAALQAPGLPPVAAGREIPAG
jgi:glycosyltransferase involved in cell wall biosynthesis